MKIYPDENGREGKGILFVISSPSGGGKSTIAKRLIASLSGIVLSISHTTREPRQGEVDGSDYHFVSVEEFERIRREGGFVEWAEVHGRSYGTGRKEIDRITGAGKDALLDIDVQGGQQIRERFPEAILVFVVPPERDELERRLRKRGTESPEQINRRLAAEVDELALIPYYDYAIRNDNLEDAFHAMRSIVTAERCRVSRRATNEV
ncbi:MAG: guanylate kinase [Deltaproteobacteria bacterium]|nr:guanylate kinase [Deltaproteobacteria bacterium]